MSLSSSSSLSKGLRYGGGDADRSGSADVDDEVVATAMEVPEDVKEGQFVVVAVDGDQPAKRFVVDLIYLTDPEFLKLLKQAEEEFRFNQKGALVIPCRPDILESILRDRTV